MLKIKMLEVPKFESEDEERDFWARHDSTDFLEGAEEVSLQYAGEETAFIEVYKEMVKRWEAARKVYELYPRLVQAMREGRHISQYERTVKEIADLYSAGG